MNQPLVSVIVPTKNSSKFLEACLLSIKNKLKLIILKLVSNRNLIIIRYFMVFRKFPNLKKPVTFSEKIQNRKLFVLDKRFTEYSDKINVKVFVEKKLGKKWIIPTIFSGPSLPPVDERNWIFPFVIKASHGSGWNIFIRRKEDCDWLKIEKQVDRWLSSKFGVLQGEHLYWNIKPQILIEPFVSKNNELPIDYKIFVFNGKPFCVQIDTGRENNHKRVFYDINWKKINMSLCFPIETLSIDKPSSLPDMLNAASILALDFPFVRIDFYDIEGVPYFGEMTFYPGSGFEKFNPISYDKMFGEKWNNN